ncbi:hypothetical protein OEZ86_006360 [Tetradesmus obliquus]|nr:hypothetical protein OEZ86_006360 [Tetradesmus obliquus]
MADAAFIVLSPGTYKPGLLGSFVFAKDITILGVGSVTLASPVSHAAWVQSGTTTLANLRLVGSSGGAAVCASPLDRPGMRSSSSSSSSSAAPSSRMIKCRVEDYAAAGLLLHGGHGELIGCCFRRCCLHAIEVRQGGSLRATDTTIDSCLQGVCAYGGARSVQLTGCSITGTSKEGLLAAGAYEDAATAAQTGSGMPPQRYGAFRSESMRKATKEAEAWGKQRGEDLIVDVTRCTISECGNFGVSLDYGCRASISCCRLQSNDPFSVFIKGGCDVLIAACQFVYSGKSAKSLWAQSTGQGALKMAGVRMGANYAGDVQVFGCAFAGPEPEAVHNEFAAAAAAGRGAARIIGMWTKPPTLVANTYHATPGQLPAIETLAAKLKLDSGTGTSGSAQQRRAAKPTAVAELCRAAIATPP